MTCGECEKKVAQALRENGVQNFNINIQTQMVRITSNKHVEDLKTVIEKTGKLAVLVGVGGYDQPDTGGTHTKQSPLGAAVVMLGRDGDYFNSNTKGVIRFNQIDKQRCVIEGTVDGLEPGDHGLAVHETGDLSQGCASLGGHYNPRNVRHGSPENNEKKRHVGDLGNIRADDMGRAKFQIVDPIVKVWDIIGRSVVVASNKDDMGLGSLPNSSVDGNCGIGVACGVIARSAGLGENDKKICQCDGVTIWDERNKPLAGPSRSNIE